MNEALRRFKAEFFKALAHPLRIQIIDALRDGERGVNDLAELLGVEPTTLSQQLAVLRARSIVTGRKEGSFVRYTVKDPAIFTLLDDAKVIFNNHLVEIRDTLESLEPMG